LGGTLVLVITLLVKAPHRNDANFVFFNFENTTGYSSKGFVVMLGFLQAVYALEGAETAAQVAEEAKRADWLAPLGIASSIAGSWLIGVICELSLGADANDKISSLCYFPSNRYHPSSALATHCQSVNYFTMLQDQNSPNSC
jgi:amino acid transporter